jgi:hypothetical protein
MLSSECYFDADHSAASVTTGANGSLVSRYLNRNRQQASPLTNSNMRWRVLWQRHLL